ncbi:flagellar basal body-associated FliL family protein [bacterium]|nr:flagellar basal body-associated FliL family protein [bacterium]
MAEPKKDEEEKKEGEEQPKKSKGLSKMLIFAAIGIVLVIVVVIVATLVSKSVKHPKIEFGVEKVEERVKPPEPLEIGNIGEEDIVSRLSDEEESHIVKVSEIYLAFEKKQPDLAMELNDPGRKFQIRDVFNTVLMTKKSTDLSTEEGRNELKRELVKKINAVLAKGQIKDIYMQMIVQ